MASKTITINGNGEALDIYINLGDSFNKIKSNAEGIINDKDFNINTKKQLKEDLKKKK